MKLQNLIIVTMSLALGGFVRANPVPAAAGSGAILTAEGSVGHGWKAEDSDNICGTVNLKRVKKPALVDYDELLKATPQIKELDRKGIDPESVEGKALRTGARTLITKTCQTVRKAKGHCSVWKVIAHKDGREIPDVTEAVLDRF